MSDVENSNDGGGESNTEDLHQDRPRQITHTDDSLIWQTRSKTFTSSTQGWRSRGSNIIKVTPKTKKPRYRRAWEQFTPLSTTILRHGRPKGSEDHPVALSLSNPLITESTGYLGRRSGSHLLTKNSRDSKTTVTSAVRHTNTNSKFNVRSNLFQTY